MGGGAWQDVVDGGVWTQGFGCVDYNREWSAPWCPSKRFHCGIDIGCAHRASVRTPRAGVVVAVGIQYLGDQAVGIRADDGHFIELGHGDQALVRVGDRVQAGQVVMLADSRGASSGDHVHLEVRTDGARQGIENQAAAVIDPTPYLHIQTSGPAPSRKETNMERVDIEPGEGRNLPGLYNDASRKCWVYADADSGDGHDGPANIWVWFNTENEGNIFGRNLDLQPNRPLTMFTGDDVPGWPNIQQRGFICRIFNNSKHRITAVAVRETH